MRKATSIQAGQQTARHADVVARPGGTADGTSIPSGPQLRPANLLTSGGAEVVGAEPRLMLSTHRVENFVRLGIRQGWDIRGSLRRAGMACEDAGQSDSL